jgi:cholesterol 24(S)-hydroxylase
MILLNFLKKQKKTKEDDKFDMEIMIDDFLTFFIAGQETTSTALAFCFYELGRNEDILRKAREEVDRIIGEKNEITYQNAIDLKYCSAIFKEALRLYPPAPIMARENQDEMDIDGYKVPKFSPIFVGLYLFCFIHRINY